MATCSNTLCIHGGIGDQGGGTILSRWVESPSPFSPRQLTYNCTVRPQDTDCDGNAECYFGKDDDSASANCGSLLSRPSAVILAPACNTRYFVYVAGADADSDDFTLTVACVDY